MAVIMDSVQRCNTRSAWWKDAVVAVLLALVVGGTVFEVARRLPEGIVKRGDVWFESDAPRVFQNMASLSSNQYRARVHPLFPLFAYSATKALKVVFGMEAPTAVRTVIALVASLWIGTIFALLRFLGCHRLDALLFSGLAASSAAAMFWLIVPETYIFGSLTILAALGVTVLAQQRVIAPLWYVATSALTLSMTVTNWMAGLLMTAVKFPWRRAFGISLAALALVVVLRVIQWRIFPTAGWLIGSRDELEYMIPQDSGGPLRVMGVFVFHSMIMPGLQQTERGLVHGERLTIQYSLPGSGSAFGGVAVGLWICLLGLGVFAALREHRHRDFRIVLGLTLIGQLVLHLLYGPETFLYALHFGPLLVLLAALSTLTRARPAALVLSGALMICLWVNNTQQFRTAVHLLERNPLMVSDHAQNHH